MKQLRLDKMPDQNLVEICMFDIFCRIMLCVIRWPCALAFSHCKNQR